MCKFNIGDKIVYIVYENNLSFYEYPFECFKYSVLLLII